MNEQLNNSAISDSNLIDVTTTAYMVGVAFVLVAVLLGAYPFQASSFKTESTHRVGHVL